MSEYLGAKYIGNDPIHMMDGSLILKGEVTKLLSPEAADNDNMFEPVYGDNKKIKIEQPKTEKKKVEKKKVVKKKYEKEGDE